MQIPAASARCLLLIVSASFLTAPLAAPSNYQEEIQSWRRNREARLKADDGWLTVAGLFWLKERESRVGAGPSNEIVLPEGSAPERVGTFLFRDGRTTFIAERGAQVTAKGRPVSSLEMRPDTTGSPDVIAIGELTMHVIQRGDRYGIRLKDKDSKLRSEFTGLRWFPVDPSYRVAARFIPHDPPELISVPNVLGDATKRPSPGHVVFTLDGKECRLHPVSSNGELFFIFRDLTAGKETYGGGRFLYTEGPKDGKVILDFNMAYNPPCAFGPYTTCPLPPPQNRLSVRIPAGEKAYHH